MSDVEVTGPSGSLIRAQVSQGAGGPSLLCLESCAGAYVTADARAGDVCLVVPSRGEETWQQGRDSSLTGTPWSLSPVEVAEIAYLGESLTQGETTELCSWQSPQEMVPHCAGSSEVSVP